MSIYDIPADEAERLRALTPSDQALEEVRLAEECEKLLRHDKRTAAQEQRLNEMLDVRELLSREAKKRDLVEGLQSGRYFEVPGSEQPRRSVNVNVKSAGRPWQVRDSRDGDELRGRAVDTLERLGATDEAIARAAAAMEEQSLVPSENNELARRIAVCANPHYARAFAKLAADPIQGHNSWTAAERAAWDQMLEARAAMAVGSAATGGAMVPTHLDPSILLTNSGSSNVMRQISRVATIAEGSVWHGVSSTGISASFDLEAAVVSDDSPTLASPSITTYQAQGFVRASVQAFDDIANLNSEIGILFADAKDRLEETKFSTGTGTNEPTGVWTTIAATTASRVTSTTAATIGLVDINAVYKAVPARHRRASTWVMNPTYSLAIKSLGTALSAEYSGDLRDASASRILNRPVAETDDAPTTQTTTALDSEVLLGNFERFLIVDRLGASAEFVPHLFDTSTGRPTGERGMYFRWRTGSGVTDTSAFALLVDRTSA